MAEAVLSHACIAFIWEDILITVTSTTCLSPPGQATTVRNKSHSFKTKVSHDADIVKLLRLSQSVLYELSCAKLYNLMKLHTSQFHTLCRQ
jgi:hypothetical protein